MGPVFADPITIYPTQHVHYYVAIYPSFVFVSVLHYIAYIKIVIFFNYIDYLNFSQSEYEIFEDEGPLCITLTLDKPALFDTTVEVIEVGNGATGKHSTQRFKVWYTKVCYTICLFAEYHMFVYRIIIRSQSMLHSTT